MLNGRIDFHGIALAQSLKLKPQQTIPEVSKTTSEKFGKFPAAHKEYTSKSALNHEVSPDVRQSENPPHLGNLIDIVAK